MRHPKMVVYEQNKLSYLNMICIRSLKDLGPEVSERDRAKALRPYFPLSRMSGII
jgi:hypothetical protein